MRLSYKHVSYVVMAGLMAFSAYYYYVINYTHRSRSVYGASAIGPEYFPNALAVILFAMGAIGIFRTVRMTDRTLEIPHAGKIFLTVLATVVLIAGWALFDAFYLFTFLLLATLFFAFGVGGTGRLRIGATSVVLALVTTVTIYLVFQVLMGLRF